MSPDSSPQREECPVTSDDLDVSDFALGHYGIESWSCSRPAWEPEATGSSRCVWHTETAEKPPNELKTEIHDGDLHGAIAPHTDLTSLELPPAPGFVDAGFSKADLEGADLSEADLYDADLSGADLRMADLSGADLRDADLRHSPLIEIDLADTTLARSTQITAPRDGLEKEVSDYESVSTEQLEGSIARANHELRTAYSSNGLIGRARHARVRERRARRREALAGEGWRGTTAWFGSILSKVFTGYGVQLTWIAGVIAVLYLASAGVYHFVGGMSVGRSLYYSVVTLTTSPPSPPPGGLTSVVAGVETFAGTAAIVFLGYVLGTRERV